MATRKIIAVPCIVKKRLKTSASKNLLLGKKSCIRISVAMTPATTKNTKPDPIYINPSFLWSTV